MTKEIIEIHDDIKAQDMIVIESIKDTIDINDPSAVLKYGIKPMEGISKFSDSLLVDIKDNENKNITSQLELLVSNIKQYIPAKMADIPKMGFMQSIIHKLFCNMPPVLDQDDKFQLLATNVDEIASHLDHSMIGLLRDNEKMEVLYQKNFDFFREVDHYVRAGKEKIKEIRENELVKLQHEADTTKSLLVAQQTKDLIDNINRFERRLQDLEISKTISMQTAPQIRIIQNNNQQLAEKIQGSILTTLPIWKSQVVLSKSLDAQKKAVTLQKEVSDTTNELLRYNAGMLQQNTIEVAKEAERSIVDIETIREVQDKLVNTIEETMKIANDARVKRASVEKELETMEDNLRLRISDVVTKNSVDINTSTPPERPKPPLLEITRR